MNKTLVFLFSLFSIISFCQEIQTQRYTQKNKGKFYISWGGNRENYTKSDITFKGENYNFTVENALAEDKPKGWHCDYINPLRMTIPQTNLKIGYFISDKYTISIGVDHMKYVFKQDQIANVNGHVNLTNNETGSMYNGTYENTPVNFYLNYSDNDENPTPPFLTFEHTDGLNFVYTEISRFDDVSSIFKIKNRDKIQINLTEGFGTGILYPKTNAKVLGKERHDDFHISGYGISAKFGLNITFFKHFFVQSEIKGGYIDMPYIKTTSSNNDKATQNFYFLQRIIAFGGIFYI